ncbi:MAG: NADH-quinone oxidoreductase subunit H [Thermoprotei archaeon]|nr:MAG: NADH-quinone oxidoreductase subunit H [Thermoprotei archaeon]
MNEWLSILLQSLIYPGLLTMIVLVIVTQWYYRKLSGRIQYRRGPTYTGPAGVLQPLADFLKLLAKEDVVNRYGLKKSPLIIAVLAIGALIALGLVTPLAVQPLWAPYDIVVIAYILLLAPLALAYLALSIPNPYSSIAAGRYLALLISADPIYISSLLTPVILAARHTLVPYSAYLTSTVSAGLWVDSFLSAITMFIAAISGFIGMMAILMIKPFDFPEAESELYWGLFTELGGPRLAMAFFIKFIEKIILPLFYVMLFLGGPWPVNPANWWLSAIVVLVKYFVVLAVIAWVDNSMPRFRPDQGIRFLWKYGYSLAFLALILSFIA